MIYSMPSAFIRTAQEEKDPCDGITFMPVTSLNCEITAYYFSVPASFRMRSQLKLLKKFPETAVFQLSQGVPACELTLGKGSFVALLLDRALALAPY